jgi:AcrR family transcriptional regulator
MARPEVSKEQRQAKREAILAAARDIFAEKGFHAAGIADIAAKLDVGHGTIYRYFENKLDIFLTLYDALNEELLRIARGTHPETATCVEDYVAEMQKFYAEFGGVFLREISHMRIFFDEVHADPEIRRRFDVSQVEFQKATERFLLIGRDKGFVRPELHIPSAARILNAMILDAMRASVSRQSGLVPPGAPAHPRAGQPESASNNLLLLAMTVIEIFTKGALAKQV